MPQTRAAGKVILQKARHTIFKNSVSRTESAVVFAAIVGLFLALFGPALRAGFYVIEDHLLLVGREWSPANWGTRIFADIETFQRFRPAYWIYIAVGDHVFGSNPHLWHAATMLWGVLTCYLLYESMRRIGADVVSAAVFVLLLIVGSNNWIWLNLIPQETTGMLLASVAVWAIVRAAQSVHARRWDVLAFLAMTGAALIKESFVILIPALLALRLACEIHFRGRSWAESFRRVVPLLAVGCALFVVGVAIVGIIVASQPSGYSATASGLSLASLAPSRLFRLLSTMELATALAVAAGVWVVLWFGKESSRTTLVAGAAVWGLWVVPQLVLYSNGIQGRYLVPAVVGVAAAIALSLANVLRRPRLWILGVVGIALILPIVARGMTTTTTVVGAFTAETVVVQDAVEFIAENVPRNRAILLAADSGTGYGFEATYSLPMYAKLAGAESPLYLWPIVATGGRSALHIAASKNNTAFRYPETMQPYDVGAIIIVDKQIPSFDSRPLTDWLGATMWREVDFTESYSALNILPLRFRKAGEVTQRVLLPADSAVPNVRPLIEVDASLAGSVSSGPLLELPPWGLERDYAGPGAIVWLGQGDAEGLGGVISSRTAQTIEIACEVVLGPSLPTTRRTVELQLVNRAGEHSQRQVFEGEAWTFHVMIEPGANHFGLKVTDQATIAVQPNGDSRRLMALLRRMTLRAPLR
jgi:hypothetical protein